MADSTEEKSEHYFITETKTTQSTEKIFSYSSRDLSLIPAELSFGFIDNYAKSHNKSSGQEHMSKGIKYFSDGYIQGISCKFKYNFFATVSNC